MNRLYAFLYDDFLSAPAFQRVIANIETRCSVLGIQGRVARLAIFRSAEEIVRELIRDGAETIVIVGNDHTLEKVMGFLPRLDVTVAYIPVSEPWNIARLLGIPLGEAACDIVAARRLETIDVGRINDRHFLMDVLIENAQSLVEIDEEFKIGPAYSGMVHIRNLGSIFSEDMCFSNAKDGWLELAIRPKKQIKKKRFFGMGKKEKEEYGEETKVLLRKGVIEHEEPIEIIVDGHRMAARRLIFGIDQNAMRFIVGRYRSIGLKERLLPNKNAFGIVSATSTDTSEKPHLFGAIVRSILRRWRNWYTR